MNTAQWSDQPKKSYFYLLIGAVIPLIVLGSYMMLRNSNSVEPDRQQPEIESMAASPLSNLNIKPNSVLSSPQRITGQIDSTWMFEGQFPVKLVDQNYELVTMVAAQEVVGGSWMSEGQVEFSAELQFDPQLSGKAQLIFAKSNPSGLPENDGEYAIPVILNSAN